MGRAYQNRKESMAKTADQKSKVYSKYGREIYVVAKKGGTDPDGNLALRGLIERAKKDQVPAHVIEKAIDKAKGGGGDGLTPQEGVGFYQFQNRLFAQLRRHGYIGFHNTQKIASGYPMLQIP